MTTQQIKTELPPLPPPGNPGAIEARLDLILRELRMLKRELRRAPDVAPELPKHTPKPVVRGQGGR